MTDRILVTGGAGFFGHHLVEHILKNSSAEVLIVDSLNYASFGFDRLRDINVYDDRRVHRYVHNLVSPIDVGLRRELGRIDYIIHCAAETHVDNSIKNPRPFLEANVIGTFNILEFARSLKDLKRFIYFSTDEVFGPAALNATEAYIGPSTPSLDWTYAEWDRFNPTNPYSATKAAGEDLSLAWGNTYGIPVIVTHTMNMFGERQHPEKFIPLCINKILAGEEILIHSTPDFKPGSRFYIHARNVADATLFIMREGANHDKYNIKGEREVDNLEMAYRIGNILGYAVNARCVDFHSSRPGHDLRYSLSGTKLRYMGYRTPVDFDTSLERTIRWFNSNRKWLQYDAQ